ncbi:MAG: hypothetical protein Q7U28_10290 [Aquabacterium sp.]|nr:hypothetical protein [Aquabacterium sp.]
MARHLTSTLRRASLIMALGMMAFAAKADIYVIVNAANPIQSLSTKEAIDLFMGRTRFYASGDHVFTCDLPRDNVTRAHFYRALTGQSQAQVNSYWARLMFTGQVMPPQSFATEQAIIDVVKHNTGAIGYLSYDPQDKNLRVVLIARDPH